MRKQENEHHVPYVCESKQECVVNTKTRTKCKYCRYMKCLKAGMKKDAVKNKRA